MHTEKFVAEVTLSADQNHVTDDYHQPAIFIEPPCSYHTQVLGVVHYGNWLL